jgi:hypothetical protein
VWGNSRSARSFNVVMASVPCSVASYRGPQAGTQGGETLARAFEVQKLDLLAVEGECLVIRRIMEARRVIQQPVEISSHTCLT